MHLPALLCLHVVCAATLALAGCAELTPRERAVARRITPNSVTFGLTDPTLFAAPAHVSHFGGIGAMVSATFNIQPTPTMPLGPYAPPPVATLPPPYIARPAPTPVP